MGADADTDQWVVNHAITCVIVDPQPVYAEGLVMALRRANIITVEVAADIAEIPVDATIVVVGIAGAALVEQAAQRVAAMVSMVAKVDQTGRPSSRIPVIVLADSSDPLPLSHILRAGAVGIVDRAADPGHIVQALVNAVEGQVQIDAPFTARLAREVASTDTLPVSPRELEVLRLMAEGLGNQQIADRLFISLNTVKNHIRSIHEKLGVRTRTAAVSVAVRQGWVSHTG